MKLGVQVQPYNDFPKKKKVQPNNYGYIINKVNNKT